MAAASDSTPAPDMIRRGFLRGLASLPLIGGSVALLGSPTAAAVPVSEALMTRYVAWLAREHAEALIEYEGFRSANRPAPERRALQEWRSEWIRQPLFWFPDDTTADAAVRAALPSTRAAVVLSAAGVPVAVR